MLLGHQEAEHRVCLATDHPHDHTLDARPSQDSSEYRRACPALLSSILEGFLVRRVSANLNRCPRDLHASARRAQQPSNRPFAELRQTQKLRQGRLVQMGQFRSYVPAPACCLPAHSTCGIFTPSRSVTYVLMAFHLAFRARHHPAASISIGVDGDGDGNLGRRPCPSAVRTSMDGVIRGRGCRGARRGVGGEVGRCRGWGCGRSRWGG